MREKFQRVTVLPIGIGQRQEVPALGRAGIVDENIEAAELAPHRLDQRLGSTWAAQIEHAHRGLASSTADRLRNLVERAFVAAGQQEIAARLGESQRDAAANAAARSGHQRDLSLQPKLHSPTPHALPRRGRRCGGELIALAREGMKGALRATGHRWSSGPADPKTAMAGTSPAITKWRHKWSCGPVLNLIR